MKKTLRLIALLIALCMVLAIGLTACKDDPDGPVDPTDVRQSIDLDDYKAYVKADLDIALAAIGDLTGKSYAGSVTAAYNAGKTNIDAAANVTAVQKALADAKAAMVKDIPYANGIYDLKDTLSSNVDKYEEVLGILENYAIRTGLTGTTLFNGGGKVMYSDRVELGAPAYIPGYGFGTLEAGKLTKALENEKNTAWQWYYHSGSATNPNTANYLNDQGSEVADFYGYFAASYYTMFMNATKDGYGWAPELAIGEPIAVNGDGAEDERATTWKFQLNKDLKYSTMSQLSDRAEYNDRPIELDDFITPYKLMLNQANGYFRGSEMAENTDSSSIKGIDTYYKATKNSQKGILSEDDKQFEGVVGVSVWEDEDDQTWWMQIELNGKTNAFFFKYYTSSSLLMPVPADFIELVGVDYYLGYNRNKTASPVDNSLALGAYMLEYWDAQEVVYKKNPNYVYAEKKYEGRDLYQIEGVHIQIIPGAATSEEAIWNEFIAGNLDAAGIPSTQFERYKSDPRAKDTIDANFKLNMNALDEATWIKMFGTNGTVTQTPESRYWDVKPAMSNSHFRSALSYALNRQSLADSLNAIAAIDFFDPEYLSDAPNGKSYNSSDAHKANVEQLLVGDDTDAYGYGLERAKDYFRMALDELEAEGKLTPGTKSNPTVITIEIAWMYPQHEGTYHNFVKQCWEDAFNDESVTGGLYELNVEFWVGTNWSDVYYNKMMLGQFDVAFGSISGNTFDPLDFMEVLSADQSISGSFTLNWGSDTSDPNADILVYNGQRWSYDALVEASKKPVQVTNGSLIQLVETGKGNFELNATTGQVQATLSIDYEEAATIVDVQFVLYGYAINEAGTDLEYYQEVIEEIGEPTNGNGTVTYKFDIPAEQIYEFYIVYGVDAYVSYSVKDGDTTIPATEIDPDSETGYIGGWDLELAAAADYGEFEVDAQGNILATVTAATILEGLTKDQLALVLYGYVVDDNPYGYAYDEIDLGDYIVGNVTATAEEGYTLYEYNLKIPADVVEQFVFPMYGIDLQVLLGKDDDIVPVTVDGWDLIVAGVVDSDIVFNGEDTIEVVLAIELMEGVDKDDIWFAFGDYFDIIDMVEPVDVEEDEEEGIVIFTFEIAAADFDGSAYNGWLDVYVDVGDATIYADSVDLIFAEVVDGDVDFVYNEDLEEDVVTITLTIDVMDGMTSYDLILVLTDGDVEINLAQYIRKAVVNRDGSITFTIKLAQSVYGVLDGEEDQWIEVSVRLGDVAELFADDSFEAVFVEPDED